MNIDLTSIIGISAVTVLVVQVILTALALSPEMSSRWGPILALGVAVVLALLGSAAVGALTQSTLASVLVTGLTAGLMAMGVHNVATKSVIGQTVSSGLGIDTSADGATNPPSG